MSSVMKMKQLIRNKTIDDTIVIAFDKAKLSHVRILMCWEMNFFPKVLIQGISNFIV